MATAARDRLARTLRGETQAAFSAELTAKMDDLNLEVEGFGHVRFPVTGTGLALSSPSYRDKELGNLGKPLASVLTAAVGIGAAGTRDAVSGHIREQADAVTALEMSALRAAAELPRAGARDDASLGDLAADCAARLRARLARHDPPATGRSNCPRAAAHAICAAPSAPSCTTRAGAPSSGRSPSRAGSTPTPGSTPPNCPSPTRPGGKAVPTPSS
jgi:hypothetical protein